MKLAVNYSQEMEALHLNGEVNFDLYKCPDWDDLITSASRNKPIYVHFPLTVGDGSIQSVDWIRIDKLLRETNTPFINLHLSAPPDLNPEDPIQVSQALQSAISDIQMVVKRYGQDVVILENLPILSEGTEFLYHVAQPGIIKQVIQEGGCNLLLDIAHVRLTAINLGLDLYAYLDQLPLDRLREFHITGIGPQPSDGILVDHLELSPEDWHVTEWCFQRIDAGDWQKPELVSFEYGGIGEIFHWRTESRVMLEQVPRLYSLVHPN